MWGFILKNSLGDNFISQYIIRDETCNFMHWGMRCLKMWLLQTSFKVIWGFGVLFIQQMFLS